MRIHNSQFSLAFRRAVMAAIMAATAFGSASAQDATGDNIFAGAGNLQPIPLDMSNDEHREFFLRHQSLAGSTPENSEGLAHFITLAAAYHGSVGVPSPGRVMLIQEGGKVDADTGEETTNDVGPIHTVTSFQQDEGNPKTYYASALASIPGQPQTCTHTLVVEDESGNPQGNGVSVTQQQACEAVHLSAQGTLDDGDQWAKTAMTYYWIDQSGTPHSGALQAEGSTIPTQITSTDPQDKNGDNMIKFCFGRSGTDCDYSPSGASRDNVFLPIVGFATYDTPIINPATDTDASVYISISKPEPEDGGGCTLQGDVSTFLSTYVTLSDGDKQINWNDPTVHFPAIGSSCMPNGSIVYYTMSMNIDLNSAGNKLPVFFGISSSPDTPVSQGNWLQLPSTRIYYSCVAEGTEITLADGQQTTIESLDVDDRIMSNRGGDAMTIYSTYKGEEEFMIRLQTESGRELLISDTHPVITEGGIVLAGDIKTGSRVRTIDGPEAVVVAEIVAYHGVVRNLSVGAESDGVPITSHNTTFFANGFLIGDNEMQWTFADERRRRLLSASGPVSISEVQSGLMK
ncbi:MAG: Hint domain-containing protein [Litorimonas sp.]